MPDSRRRAARLGRTARSSRHRHPLRVESLEERTLLSVTVFFSEGVLYIDSTDNSANSVTLSAGLGGGLLINSQTPAISSASTGELLGTALLASQVTCIRLDVGSGADNVDFSAVVPQTFPSIISGCITISAGGGDNVMVGSEFSDILLAGNGADLVHGLDGDDLVRVGDGNNTVFGAAGDDTIETGEGNDVVYAGAGNDLVRSGAGNDNLSGGSGDDILQAGPGDDIVAGQEGADLIDGQAGADTIVASAESRVIFDPSDQQSMVGEDVGAPIFTWIGTPLHDPIVDPSLSTDTNPITIVRHAERNLDVWFSGRAFDPDGDPIQYSWFVLAPGVSAEIELDLQADNVPAPVGLPSVTSAFYQGAFLAHWVVKSPGRMFEIEPYQPSGIYTHRFVASDGVTSVQQTLRTRLNSPPEKHLEVIDRRRLVVIDDCSTPIDDPNGIIDYEDFDYSHVCRQDYGVGDRIPHEPISCFYNSPPGGNPQEDVFGPTVASWSLCDTGAVYHPQGDPPDSSSFWGTVDVLYLKGPCQEEDLCPPGTTAYPDSLGFYIKGWDQDAGDTLTYRVYEVTEGTGGSLQLDEVPATPGSPPEGGVVYISWPEISDDTRIARKLYVDITDSTGTTTRMPLYMRSDSQLLGNWTEFAEVGRPQYRGLSEPDYQVSAYRIDEPDHPNEVSMASEFMIGWSVREPGALRKARSTTQEEGTYVSIHSVPQNSTLQWWCDPDSSPGSQCLGEWKDTAATLFTPGVVRLVQRFPKTADANELMEPASLTYKSHIRYKDYGPEPDPLLRDALIEDSTIAAVRVVPVLEEPLATILFDDIPDPNSALANEDGHKVGAGLSNWDGDVRSSLPTSGDLLLQHSGTDARSLGQDGETSLRIEFTSHPATPYGTSLSQPAPDTGYTFSLLTPTPGDPGDDRTWRYSQRISSGTAREGETVVANIPVVLFDLLPANVVLDYEFVRRLPSGVYKIDVEAQETYLNDSDGPQPLITPEPISTIRKEDGQAVPVIVNVADDLGFGEGWQADGVDRLLFALDDNGDPIASEVYWKRSDGRLYNFSTSNRADGDLTGSVLSQTGNPNAPFRLTDKYGTISEFSIDTTLIRRIDRFGNQIRYQYDDHNLDGYGFEVTDIIDELAGRSWHFDYYTYPLVTDGRFGHVRSITETAPDGGVRESLLSYYVDVPNGRVHLTNLQRPNPGAGYGATPGFAMNVDSSGTSYCGATLPSPTRSNLLYIDQDAVGGYQVAYDCQWDTFKIRTDGLADSVGAPANTVIPTRIRSRWTSARSHILKDIEDQFIPVSNLWTVDDPSTVTPPLEHLPREMGNREGKIVDSVSTTKITSDDFGYLSSVENQRGYVRDYENNLQGQVTKYTSPIIPGGRLVTEYAYDENHNLVSIEYPDGTSTETWQYDSISRLLDHVDPTGRHISHSYSGAGGGEVDVMTLHFRGEGGVVTPYVTTTTRNAKGNVILIVDPNLVRTKFTYTSAGPAGSERLESVIYADMSPLQQRILNQEFDTFGNVTLIKTDTGPIGSNLFRLTERTFDRLDRLRREKEGDPGFGQTRPETTYTYHTYGEVDLETRVVAAAPAQSIVSTFRFGRGYRLEESFVGGIRTQFLGYDKDNYLTSSTDALQRQTRYERDELHLVTRTVYPDPNVVETTYYDPLDRPTYFFDPLNSLSLVFYDDLSHPAVRFERDGGRWQTAYDAIGQLLVSRDPRQRETIREYNDHWLIASIRYPDPNQPEYITNPNADRVNSEITFGYDPTGFLTSRTDQYGNITNYEPDERYHTKRILLPAPEPGAPRPKTTNTYTRDGALRSVTEVWTLAGGERTTNYEQDLLGRQHRVLLPPDPQGFQAVTEYIYDGAHRVASTKDARDFITQFEYNDFNNILVERRPIPGPNATQPVTTYRYDDAQQLRAITESGDDTRARSFGYDLMGRVVREFSPDPINGSEWPYDDNFPVDPPVGSARPYMKYDFDDAGNLLSALNAAGNGTIYEDYRFHGNGYKPSSTRDAEEHTTSYDYLRFIGLVTAITDPNLNRTSFSYDDLDRLVREINQLEAPRYSDYDLVGNMVWEKDRNARITTFAYDDLYRRTHEHWMASNGTTVSHTIATQHDLSGNLISASGPEFNYTYAPDNLNRVSGHLATLTGMTGHVGMTFGHDLTHNRTRMSASTLSSPDFTDDSEYDGLGRLSMVSRHSQAGGAVVASQRVEFTYNSTDEFDTITRRSGLLATSPIVSRSQFQFDRVGRPKNLEHRAGIGGTILANYALNWDPEGRLDDVTSLLDGFSDYGYDKLGQIKSSLNQSSNPYVLDESYNYDPNGNRISAAYTSGSQNFGGTNFLAAAYWPANEGNGTLIGDVTSNDLDLTAIGVGIGWLNGSNANDPRQKAVTLDGYLSYLERAASANSAALGIGTGDYSFSAWIKPASASTQRMVVVAHGKPTTTAGVGFELQYRADMSSRPLELYVNAGAKTAQKLVFYTQQDLIDGDWHQVGFTIDRDGQTRLYLDGVAVKAATSSQTGNIAPNLAFRVGGNNITPQPLPNSGTIDSSLWFNGEIDEIKVFHAALSPADMSNFSQNLGTGYSESYNIGANNRLLEAGGYSYYYDGEGNRTIRNNLNGIQLDWSLWDYRNRLTTTGRYNPRETAFIDFESNEGSRLVDIIGHVPDGVLAGDAELTKDAPPQASSETSLALDGIGDYATFGINDTFVVGPSGLSLMAWFQPGSSAADQTILSFGDLSSGIYRSGYRLFFDGTSGAQQLVFQLNSGNDTTIQTLSYSLGAATNIVGQWHHVGISIDRPDGGTPNPQIKLYFDGVLHGQVSLTETANWGSLATGLVIGANAGGISGYFGGMIDDVRVMPGAISAGDLIWSMNNATPVLYETQRVSYTYDHLNRMISRIVGSPGMTPTSTEFFVYDGMGTSVGQIVMTLDASGAPTHRQLWGPLVDQLLADEQVSQTIAGLDPVWLLTDHQGTARDFVRYDAGTDSTTAISHRTYDAFGILRNVQGNQSVDVSFGYTGRFHDSVTGVQYNLNRWYDPAVGRWISEDPIGFAGGDANLSRYVGNQSTTANDPSGLMPPNMSGQEDTPWDIGYDRTDSEQASFLRFMADPQPLARNRASTDVLPGSCNGREGLYVHRYFDGSPRGSYFFEVRRSDSTDLVRLQIRQLRLLDGIRNIGETGKEAGKLVQQGLNVGIPDPTNVLTAVLAKYGIKYVMQGSEWVLVRGGQILEGKSLEAVKRLITRFAPKGVPSQLNVSGRQFGPKMAQRARELGLDPSSPQVRHQLRSRIQRIFDNADEVRSGPFRGQGPNGTVGGDNRFFRRGNDVVVTNATGDFITLLTDGVNNGFFKGGVPLP